MIYTFDDMWRAVIASKHVYIPMPGTQAATYRVYTGDEFLRLDYTADDEETAKHGFLKYLAAFVDGKQGVFFRALPEYEEKDGKHKVTCRLVAL